MIPELGHAALIVALQLALLQGILGLTGASRDTPAWMAMARGAAAGQLLFVAVGFLVLVWSFLVNDFSVMNVADHSSRFLPVEYRITAAWGSHEGSFLLWTLLMSAWTVAVVLLGRKLPADLHARVIGIMGLLSFCFLAYLLFTSNPFMRLHPPPANGSDLNPLLQDPGMIIHPPLLYMGYVGFSVAFAFAIAALISGRLDAAWARWVRPWTLMAWVFLTLGIMVGSWWAYYELGWGGWWFWDPSENASLMPWLAGTALLHSLMVTEQRGALRVWTVFLALTAFALSLVGTFLVRSGVLSSVHAFALDPLRGLFILIFLCILIGASLILFAKRASAVKTVGNFSMISRETAMLTGNVLLLAALATVLLGTLYPLILDAFGLGKISVGPPYFNAVFVPMMVPVLLLLGIAPWMRWGQESLRELLPRLRWQAAVAVLIGLALPFAFDAWRWQAALGLVLAAWMILATVSGLVARRRAVGSLPLSTYGMGCAHVGLAIGIIGMGLVSAYQSEKTVAMETGDTASLGRYEFVFRGAAEVPGPNYSAMRGTVELKSNGQTVATLLPEKRIYLKSNMTMTEAAIRYGFAGDVYVAMGEPLPGGVWSMQLYLKPFVGWLWGGALLMALGGLLAALGVRKQGAKE
ncbi:MAG: heme lyase CcmF/NrfE family subunit [Rhodocyclaceae bacterium]|nr:heme lyase CcmF/NrfE family subunit [Rhodocyclaceae bacterium]MDZ4214655.1 heme lyase CcmF/NrfE family subunit [Rhodocyclaceae bacterium]